MKPDKLIYKVKITAGLADLAYRSKLILITGVLGADHALQTAIFWAESHWYPDWLTIEVTPFVKDFCPVSSPMVFKRQFPTFYQPIEISICVDSE
jgi:hypothetical protein